MTARPVRPALAGATVLCAVSVLVGPPAVAVPGGLLLGFVLPGLALVGALFPADHGHGSSSGGVPSGSSADSSVGSRFSSGSSAASPGRASAASRSGSSYGSWDGMVSRHRASRPLSRVPEVGPSSAPGPRARGRRINTVERVVLPPALSLAVLVVAGLTMYLAGITLNRAAWTAATTVVTLIALPVPAFRRSRRGEPPGSPARTTLSMRRIVPLVLAVAMLGAAGAFSLADARHTADVTVTALSAAPPQPIRDGRRTVTVTASGLVAAEGPYTLVVTGPDGAETIRRTLDATGGTWTADLLAGPGRTSIALYRPGGTSPYRILYIAAAQP